MPTSGSVAVAARRSCEAAVTHQRYVVPTVVCVHDRRMKEARCLAGSDPTASASVLIDLYAKRWSIEPSFCDTKDLRYGMSLSWTYIKRPERRDRILFVAALAIVLLTLLGAAGESLEIDHCSRSMVSSTGPSRSSAKAFTSGGGCGFVRCTTISGAWAWVWRGAWQRASAQRGASARFASRA